MDFAELLKYFRSILPSWVTVGLGSVLAFFITFITIPVIVRVAHLKNLCAIPNDRSSHADATPNLGGVALFTGFVISTLIVAGDQFSRELSYIICAIVILFFVGLKDDILIIDPKKKLAAQFVVAVIITVFADIRIEKFFEIFNIGTIAYVPSIILSVISIVLIINGFNLIDGIDGLAAGTGILASLAFGTWFLIVDTIAYTVMCFSLAGALIAFFIFNVYGRKNKIFMGDTGSLMVGLAVSIMMIHFLQQDKSDQSLIMDKTANSSPALALGVVILPVFDTLRIFILRIAQKKSPFIADHQHIHHRLLEMGYSHRKSTFILMSVNLLILVFSFILKEIGDILLISIIIALATILSYLLTKLAERHKKSAGSAIRHEGVEETQTSIGTEVPEEELQEVEMDHY